jgi:predicted RNase H-like nuclease
MWIAGIDGCKAGWVCLSLDLTTRVLNARVLATLEDLDPALKVVGIDVPIGLSDEGQRQADRLAREKLTRLRASSVFPCPIRPALDARCWEEACDITYAHDGRRVSKQTYAILRKIREADLLMRGTSPLRNVLYEVHPEVSFAEWRGEPMAHRKKSALGREERAALIGGTYGENALEKAWSTVRGSGVAHDDVVDAFATLWSAERIFRGVAKRLPETAAVDSCGLPMHIWF